MNTVEIIDWEDRYAGDFVSLSLQWLQKYVSVEPLDLEILNNPQELILDKGGRIFFARQQEEIIGTVAMIKAGPSSFELAKLAVTEKCRGLKVGNLLMDRCLELAREKQGDEIILYSNHKLKPALALYKKYGFREEPLSHNKYLESDLKMKLSLKAGRPLGPN